MLRGVNTRVLGATIVGGALVCGAWTLNSLQSGPADPLAAVSVSQVTAPERVTIAVTDSNADGIEDWQEPFLTAEPILLGPATNTVELENTLTEQISIKLMENYLLTKSTGQTNGIAEPLVGDALRRAELAAQDIVFGIGDISIIANAAPNDVRTYANAAATIFSNNDIKGVKNEALLLEQALNTSERAAVIAQIKNKAAMYEKNRDELRALPVPADLVEPHLDLINVFHALAESISAMGEVERDPIKTLVRVRRYQDDASGLVLALRSMHTALSRYPSLFSASDQAILFSGFSASGIPTQSPTPLNL